MVLMTFVHQSNAAPTFLRRLFIFKSLSLARSMVLIQRYGLYPAVLSLLFVVVGCSGSATPAVTGRPQPVTHITAVGADSGSTVVTFPVVFAIESEQPLSFSDVTNLGSATDVVWFIETVENVGNVGNVVKFRYKLTVTSATNGTIQPAVSGRKNRADFLNIAITISGTVATPTSDVAAGNYSSTQTVTLSSSTSSAVVHYTTDGTVPTCSSATGTVSVSASMTVKAIACKTDYTDSALASFTYVIDGTVATPTSTLTAGTYSSTQTVPLASSTSGAVLHYTIDNTTPTCSSATYSVALTVSSSTTIQAIACKTGYTDSAVASFAYVINPITPVAVEAFPDTTTSTISWTPNVKFSIGSADTLGLYSDTIGTGVNTPVAVTAGSNTLAANVVTSLGATASVYAKSTSGSDYVNMGSYTTKRPPSYSLPGMDGAVTALAVDASGNLYVGGSFSAAGLVAASRVVKFNPATATWTALGTGMDNTVYALAVDSTSTGCTGGAICLYAGGAFTSAGGVANTAYMAKWNGSTWTALGTGMNAQVSALALDSTSAGCTGGATCLHAGGLFTSAGGVANTSYMRSASVRELLWRG
jgi:Chitobiase/beta-hexosaminidase C-terminal domain